MKTKQILTSALAACAALALTTGSAKADPSSAEEDAYSMSVHYTQRGYAMAPTNTSGVGSSGTMIRFIVPVSKGLDYVFLAGIDTAVRDIDIYVYDEVGSLILDDRRPSRRAGVKFRSAYNGTVQVYLHIRSANGLGAYSVLVGRRGAVREKYSPTNPDGTLVADPASSPTEAGNAAKQEGKTEAVAPEN